MILLNFTRPVYWRVADTGNIIITTNFENAEKIPTHESFYQLWVTWLINKQAVFPERGFGILVKEEMLDRYGFDGIYFHESEKAVRYIEEVMLKAGDDE